MTDHPCPNCRALYRRIERANELATAVKPLVDALRYTGSYASLVATFDLFCAVDATEWRRE